MHIGRWFCSSCLASGTLGDDPNLRKVCTDIDKEWKICTDIMFRNQDADLRKVCTKILCKVQARCREPLRARWFSHTLPFPDLWLVDEDNWFAPSCVLIICRFRSHRHTWNICASSFMGWVSGFKQSWFLACWIIWNTFHKAHTTHTQIQKQAHLVVCLLPTNWRFNLW